MKIFDNRLFASAGHYLPSFFKMEVLTTESFSDIDTLSEEAAAVYFHEYLHYIQDISTFNGFSNMIRMGEYIHYAISVIKAGGQTFKVPINPQENDSGVDTTVKIIKVLNGDYYNNSEITVSNVELRISNLRLSHGYMLPEVIVTYNGNLTYNFGASAIMESMAYIGEYYFFPIKESPATFPYKSAELVAKFVFPGFAENILNVFSLCDVSLLTSEPGPSFYRGLLKLKDINYSSNNPKDIYEIFSHEIFEFEGNKLNQMQMLSALVVRANLYLSGYFPQEKYKDNIEWMKHVSLYGFSLRHANIAFPLDILLHGSFYKNPILRHIMTYIGSPLQLNMDDRASFIIIEGLKNENFQPDLNWAIAQVHKVFLGSKGGCEMKTFCKQSAHLQNIPDFTNKQCDTNPWNRVRNRESCSFVRVIEMWGLQNNYPLNASVINDNAPS
ncbi:MAG: hypothetical protein EOP45_01080 [Sphingobacteriaceae bacterium]|nr:MAG: hypothetical protein EOP45_01080 [Sphingobacteriaceae bacterium]